ncbi:MAG: T9SS type A sorting domain-containing protein [bacterium]|nr:T9SS type A sorting domain-containing protein [bacterium]
MSNPSSPQEVGFYNTLGTSCDVVVSGSNAYVADYYQFGIYACTHFSGTVELESPFVPSQFSLKPNYPNPFNPTTEIRYAIAKTSKVDLRVFDVTGREVAKLIDFHQNPGEYTFHFDGKALSAGTYFVRLQAGGFAKTQKMVLLR